MKAAGLKRTAFGVESGDPDILRSIDKRVDLDTVRRAFKDAKDVGLETIGFFIIGLPGETEETMERTIRFACELDPMIANFSMLTPYPGTKAYEIARQQGHMLVNDWEDYIFFEGKARYEMGAMTAPIIERKWKESYRRFYLRPHRIVRTLARKDFWINWRRTFRMAFRTLFPRQEKTELKREVQASV
jgi:anaerobic magnesium-protoporphyrin IX monomethyl ester cyclase